MYTWPEMASVGMSEEDAKAAGSRSVGAFPFWRTAAPKAMGRRDGHVKIVARREERRHLGAHIVGRASDLIAELVLAVEMGREAPRTSRALVPRAPDAA